MKELKKHSCPICGILLVEYERYPRYVCPECKNKATDIKRRRLGIHNFDFSGGYSAKYIDTDESYDSHTCYIVGVECYADEAKFGGIVVQTILR